jgi:hypothetical protein
MIFKDSDEINKKEKNKTTVTVANRGYCSKPPSKTARGGDLAGIAKFRK